MQDIDIEKIKAFSKKARNSKKIQTVHILVDFLLLGYSVILYLHEYYLIAIVLFILGYPDEDRLVVWYRMFIKNSQIYSYR